MKKWRVLFFALLCILTVSATGCGSSDSETSQQVIEASLSDLTLKVSGNGNLDIIDEAKLAFGTGGKIDNIYVARGDVVTKGMVLAELDTNALQLSLVQAEAAVAQAKYNLSELLDNPSLEDIEAARAAVTAAEDYLQYAKDNQQYLEDNVKYLEDSLIVAKSYYKRIQVLNDDYVTEQAQASLSGAQASLSGARVAVTAGLADISRAEASLKSAQTQLQDLLDMPAQDAVDMANAQLAAAEKSVAEINRQINEAVITATMSGVVAEKVTAKVGDTVPAAQPIIHVVDLSQMELVVDVDEIDIPQTAIGQKTKITFDAIPDFELDGTVSYISPLPTETGGIILYKVTITFDVPEGIELKDGMSASADIIVEDHPNVIVLPNRAISQDSQGNDVIHIKTDSGTEERRVTTGISDGFNTEIVEGLSVGEKVIVPKTGSNSSSSSLFGM